MLEGNIATLRRMRRRMFEGGLGKHWRKISLMQNSTRRLGRTENHPGDGKGTMLVPYVVITTSMWRKKGLGYEDYRSEISHEIGNEQTDASVKFINFSYMTMRSSYFSVVQASHSNTDFLPRLLELSPMALLFQTDCSDLNDMCLSKSLSLLSRAESERRNSSWHRCS